MKRRNRVLSLLPLLILWLLLSVFLWGFVFDKLTDTAPENKITLCVDGEAPGAADLAVRLEEGLGGGVRMVKVRPFTYAMLDSRTLTGADLFIVPASHVEAYRDWFSPLPGELASGEGVFLKDGVPLGVLVYDAEKGKGAAEAYISYRGAEGAQENYYLLFGKESVHTPGNEGAKDDGAVAAARLLLAMGEEQK